MATRTGRTATITDPPRIDSPGIGPARACAYFPTN
jgi:hypothetical protein